MFYLFSFYHERLFECLKGLVKRKILEVACERNSLALKAFSYQSNLDPALRESPGHELSVHVQYSNWSTSLRAQLWLFARNLH